MATILQILKADSNLSLFSSGINKTELETKLNEIGPFTILGPINLALRGLSSLTYEQLLQPENSARLFNILSGYILSGKKMFHDFRHDQKLESLNGNRVVVTIKNEDTYINGAKILSHNRQGSNGVIHMLDKTYAMAPAE